MTEIAKFGSHFLPLNVTLYSLLPKDVNILIYVLCVISFAHSDQYHIFAAVSAVLKKSAVFLICEVYMFKNFTNR